MTGGSIFCTSCGQRLDAGTQFCTSCGAQVVSADVAAAPPAQITPISPEKARRFTIIAGVSAALIALLVLAYLALAPLLTDPAKVANRFVAAAARSDSVMVAKTADPSLGAGNASAAQDMLDGRPGAAFKTKSVKGLSAVATMEAEGAQYTIDLKRGIFGQWRVSRIEIATTEEVTEEIEAPEPAIVESDLWPSDWDDMTLSESVPGERSVTLKHVLVNGKPKDDERIAEKTTLEPVTGRVLRGTGAGADSDWVDGYSSGGIDEGDGEFLSSIRLAITSFSGASVPAGVKVQGIMYTPDGGVVKSEVQTNDGKPDDGQIAFIGWPTDKTLAWKWTPSGMRQYGDAQHPADSWLEGTYVLIYTANGERVGYETFTPSY